MREAWEASQWGQGPGALGVGDPGKGKDWGTTLGQSSVSWKEAAWPRAPKAQGALCGLGQHLPGHPLPNR